MTATMARRPLLISFVAIAFMAAASLGFNPNGSNFKSPAHEETR
jgi:hypothetical protein